MHPPYAPHKKILCLDFDGVLHSYTSGWKGARNIPDPPVPGAIVFLLDAMEHFDVCVLSSRSHQWGGRRAMKRWLMKHIADHIANDIAHKRWLARCDAITTNRLLKEGERQAKYIVRKIGFPRYKPPAHVTIDDRAVTFNGMWPVPRALLMFQPWNKRTV